MTHFSIDRDNNIAASASQEQAVAASTEPLEFFTDEKDLLELTAQWPGERLVAIWNSLPGVTTVTRFRDRKTAVSRIWKRIQCLGQTAPPKEVPASAPVAPSKPRKPKAGKNAATPHKGPNVQETATARQGSKTAQVVALLQRKNGATLQEIMERMAWQKHTVRGFMAGAMKKAGYVVESFKPDGGERTYRIRP